LEVLVGLTRWQPQPTPAETGRQQPTNTIRHGDQQTRRADRQQSPVGAGQRGPDPQGHILPNRWSRRLASSAPPEQAVEVDRKVKSDGMDWICHKQIWAGETVAGQIVTIRVEASVLHIICHGWLIRTLPSHIPTDRRAKLYGVRPASQAPTEEIGVLAWLRPGRIRRGGGRQGRCARRRPRSA
jgi:hypothetical protein